MAYRHNPRPSALCLTLILGIALAPALSAQTTSLEERVAALEKQLTALAAENKALKEKQSAKPSAAPLTAAGKEDKLILGGFIHAQAEVGDAPDSRYAGVQDRFLVRRARVNLRGNFGKDWSFKLESDFGANTLGNSASYRAQITDAHVDWTANPLAQVRLGQFKTPFGWEQLLSDTQNPFVERSLPNDRLTASRQIGLGLSGTAFDKRLEYSVGAFNGNGVNNSNNDNSNFFTAGRVAFKAWSGKVAGKDASWTVATNAFTTRDTGTFVGDRDGLGFDTQFAAGPVTLRAEWLQNKNTPRTGTAITADGWYAAAIYDLTPKWQLAARYESYDPDTALGANDSENLVLGLNHRFVGNDVVLGVNYVAGNADLGGGDDRFLARLQLVF
jgi:phosphate-selective porin OprO and OprP